MRPRRAAVCAVLLGLMSTPPAWAQSPSGAGANADLSQQATDLYNEGTRAARKFDWEKARTFFLGAWRIQHHWQIAVNLGNAEFNAKKFRDAAEHLAYFLREAPAPEVSPATRKEMQALLDQAKAKVGTLIVTVEPAGAEVAVDGEAVGKAPLPGAVFVEQGPRVVEAKLEGWKPGKGEKTVAAGEEGKVELRLEKEAVKVVPPPVALRPLSPAEGGGAGVPSSTGPRTGVLVAGGVTAGAALIAGVVFTLAANGKVSAAREKNSELIKAKGPEACAQPGACAEVLGALQDWTKLKDGALWSFVGAGSLGLATGIYALVAKSTPTAGLRAAPVVTASGGGVMIGGNW